MTIFEMLEQSGILTLLGMAVVFSFLVIMIIAINFTGKVIHALGWDKSVQPAAGPAVKKTGNDAAVTAAIGAAVNQYRKNH
ncbi:MAG: OadG family protein [Treponema sp.]|jgi:oxaloacetate decarboxylase gamma subunit|nr:OadG family protein [Treponema sp.]